MTILYQDPSKKRRSGAEGNLPGIAQDIWDFADQYDQAKRRAGQDAAMAADRRRWDARFSAYQQAEAARQRINAQQMQWEQQDRDRILRGQQADAELQGMLLRGMRPGGGAEASPEYGPQIPQQQGPQADGLPLGAEARAAELERRKWDEFERLSPDLSPEGRKYLYGQLAAESARNLENAKWGTITRRFAGLTTPSQTTRGGEVKGLNAEDPKQAELLGNIQWMIESRTDPDSASELISELEAEILRDAQALERREATLETMQRGLAPENTSGLEAGQLAAMQQVWHRYQRDPGMDPDEAYNEFLDAQKRTVRDARGAGTSASVQLKPAPGAHLALPRYATDVDLREKAIKELLQGAIPGTQPSEQEIRSRMDMHDPSIALEQGLAVGRQAVSQNPPAGAGQSSAQQDVGAVAAMMGAKGKPFTAEALPDLEAAVDAAKGDVQAADAAISAALKKRGVREENVPESVLKALWERLRAAADAPGDKRAADESGYGGAQDVARGMAEGLRSKSAPKKEDLQYPGTSAAPSSPKGKTIAQVSAEAADRGMKRGALLEATTTTWKRLPKEKQADLRKQLLAAAASATRFDFHGALAPVLRAAGVDLGSVPRAIANEYREALKKARAKAKKAQE